MPIPVEKRREILLDRMSPEELQEFVGIMEQLDEAGQAEIVAEMDKRAASIKGFEPVGKEFQKPLLDRITEPAKAVAGAVKGEVGEALQQADVAKQTAQRIAQSTIPPMALPYVLSTPQGRELAQIKTTPPGRIQAALGGVADVLGLGYLSMPPSVELSQQMFPGSALAGELGGFGALFAPVPGLAAGASLPALMGRGALEFGAYGLLRKPEEGETRLGNVVTDAIIGGAFPVGVAAIKAIAKPLTQPVKKAVSREIESYLRKRLAKKELRAALRWADQAAKGQDVKPPKVVVDAISKAQESGELENIIKGIVRPEIPTVGKGTLKKIREAQKPGRVLPKKPVSATAETGALAKEPWEMTRKEFRVGDITSHMPRWKYRWREVSTGKVKYSNDASKLSEIIDRDHKAVIKQALSEGKPVPLNVLKSYPDLAKKAPKPPVRPKPKKPQQPTLEALQAEYQKLVEVPSINPEQKLRKQELSKEITRRVDAGEEPKDVKLYSGIPLDELPDAIRGLGKTMNNAVEGLQKIGASERQSVNDVWEAVNDLYGVWQEADVRSVWAFQDFKKAIPNVDRRKLLSHYREQPDKFAGKLSTIERAIGDAVGKEFDKLWEVAKENGILESWIANYIPHIFKDPPSKVFKAFYPKGGKRLGTKPFFTYKRKLNKTIEELKAMGLHPIEDPAVLLSASLKSLYRAMGNQKFVELLKNLEGETGHKLIYPATVKGIPPDYVYVDLPELSRWVGFKTQSGATALFKPGIKADPEVAQILKRLFDPLPFKGRFYRTINWLRNKVRRVKMFNPAIHGVNIYSDLLDEFNFNIARATKEMMKAGKLWEDRDDIILEMARNSVNFQLSRETSTIMKDAVREMYGGKLFKAMKPLSKLEEVSDELLWGKIVRNAQIATYILKKGQLLKEGVSEIKAGKEAAHYVNDLYGTLPHWWHSRGFNEFTRFSFFAPNWTVSNIRLVLSSLGMKGMYKGLSKNASKRLSRKYALHLMKGIGGMLMFNDLMNVVMPRVTTGKWGDHFWKNEEGHKLDINTGLKDNRGRAVYVKGHLFRYIHDLLNWPIDPTRTFLNKMEPLLKGSMEELINFRIWGRREIRPRGAPLGAKVKGTAEHILETLTPIGSLRGPKGDIRTPFEIVFPFSGSWVSHGIAGGRIAKKLLDYRAELGYKEDQIDLEASKLIQKGNLEGALELLLDNERYADPKSYLNPFKRNFMPMTYKLKMGGMSKKERDRFLNEVLTDDERKLLLDILKAEEEAFRKRSHRKQ